MVNNPDGMRCQVILDDNGEVLAVGRVSADITEEGLAALRRLIHAAQREMATDDAGQVSRAASAAARRSARMADWAARMAQWRAERDANRVTLCPTCREPVDEVSVVAYGSAVPMRVVPTPHRHASPDLALRKIPDGTPAEGHEG